MKKLKNKWVTKTPETRLYQIPVPIIGLTGGIGTGKTSVAEILREKNIPVIDADKLVKNIYQKHETVEFIQKNFPHVIKDNIISFQQLREIAFSNTNVKKMIEDFVYSYLPDEFKKTYSKFKTPTFIVYDVPLLFEKNLDHLVDLSVCVYAPKKNQIERIVLRDKSKKELAETMIANQMDIEEKKKKSDLIILNTDGQNKLKISVEEFLNDVLS